VIVWVFLLLSFCLGGVCLFCFVWVGGGFGWFGLGLFGFVWFGLV
jgi:hypothetical protein